MENGTQDTGEPGVEDVNVTITDSKGNVYHLVTDASGSYSQSVPEGNATVET